MLAAGGVLLAAVGTVPAVAGKVSQLRRSGSEGETVHGERHAAARSTPTATTAGYQPGLVQREISVGGVQRTFWWQRPANGVAGPLVIALHGLHATALGFAEETGLPAATAAQGVTLVVPETDGPAWNDGRLGADGPDDQDFLLAIVHTLVAEGVVDPDRVVVTGFSNGAGMTLVMAGEHPDVLAGAVAVSGELLTGEDQSRPEGGATVPVWLTHGDADPVQPWEGRPSLAPLLPSMIGEDATVDVFREANRSAAVPSRRELPAGPVLTGPIQVTTWAATGEDSAPVTLYRLPGAGHVWPSDGTGTHAYGFSATRLVLQVATTAER